MSHVADRKADKKHGEPVQVMVEEASAEAAILRMMGTRQDKERVADAADAPQLAPPPAPAATPSQAPAAGASPAKPARQREATPTKAREGTPGAGTPNKNRLQKRFAMGFQ